MVVSRMDGIPGGGAWSGWSGWSAWGSWGRSEGTGDTSAFACMQLMWMSYALPLLGAAWSAAVQAARHWIAPRTRTMVLADGSDKHARMREFIHSRAVDVDSVTTAGVGSSVPSVPSHASHASDASDASDASFVPSIGVSHHVLVAVRPCASGWGRSPPALRCTSESVRFLATSSSVRDRLIASAAWMCLTSSVVVCVKLEAADDENSVPRTRTALTAASALLRGDALLAAMRALVDLSDREFRRNHPGTITRFLAATHLSTQINVRPLSSVVLHAATRRALVEGIRDFNTPAVRALYARIGRPLKLCVLIHGPPGTGKSSVLPALGELFGANRMFSYSTCDDNSVNQASKYAITYGGLIVFEDVDRSFAPQAGDEAMGKPKPVALGPLLELLDGAHCGAEPLLIVLTANDVDALPAVMLRPGRVDMVVEFGYATEAMLAEYVRLFFDGSGSGGSDAMAALMMKAMGPRVTLAQVQAFMFEHRGCSSTEEALDALAALEARAL